MMKRYVLILMLCALSLSGMAITQQGVVRTIARPNKASVQLPNAVIRVRGQHNAVESQIDGSFSLLLQNKQNGDALVFSSIVLSGYEPAEPQLVGRQLACSDRVPIELLMVNRADLQRETEDIARKARQNVEIYYEQRLAHLDSLLAEGALAQKEYEQRLNALEDKYEQFEPLMQTMAEQYARTDIARLDSLTLLINAAIENGNPDEAERLIRLKGDLDKREQALRDNDAQLQHAQQMLDRAAQANKQQRQELGDDLYRLYSVCLNRFELDSAGYYLCRRANLDTTEVYWQLDAGKYMLNQQQDYAQVTNYLLRAARQATEQYGKESTPYAIATNELGLTFKRQGKTDEARQYYQESLSIRERLYGQNNPAVAEALNNIGELQRMEKDYSAAVKTHQRALRIRKASMGEQNAEVAESLNNIGGIFYAQGKYKQALAYFEEAVNIFAKLLNPPLRKQATALNNMGGVSYQLGDKEAAAQYFERAYQLYLRALGDKHSLTRNAKNNYEYCKQTQQ